MQTRHLDHDDRVLGHVVARFHEREHGVRRILLEAVVSLAPQVDEVIGGQVTDDPLRTIREVQRRASAVCTNIDCSASSCSIICVSAIKPLCFSLPRSGAQPPVRSSHPSSRIGTALGGFTRVIEGPRGIGDWRPG
jgi:hypothetical protein